MVKTPNSKEDEEEEEVQQEQGQSQEHRIQYNNEQAYNIFWCMVDATQRRTKMLVSLQLSNGIICGHCYSMTRHTLHYDFTAILVISLV